MRALSALLIATSLLSGCAYLQDSTTTKLNKFVGQPETLLIKVVGTPTRHAEKEGHRYLVYVEHQTDTFGGYDMNNGYANYGTLGFRKQGFEANPALYEKECVTIFQVDAGRITNYTRTGGACED
jgi:hypothetical protein